MYAKKIVITVTCEIWKRKNDHSQALNGSQHSYTTATFIRATTQQKSSNQALSIRRKYIPNRVDCVEYIIEKKRERNTYLGDEVERNVKGDASNKM